MKKFSLIHHLLLAGGIIGLGFLAMPAFGQDAGKVQELQRVIEAQQKQLEAQQKLLEAQQKQLDGQQKQLEGQMQSMQKLQKEMESLVKDADTEGVAFAAEKPPAKPPADSIKAQPQRRAELSQMDKFDRDSPTGSNVTYFDPTKTINIPGTDTDIGLHGMAEFQIIHDTDGFNNNRFDTKDIPVDGASSQTKFNVNPSRIMLSSTTPIQAGQLNTMISMDFNGENDRPEPRLRVVYGEYINYDLDIGLLAGQTYTTMLDLRAVPETLDFAGPAGLWQQRQPLFRVTKAFTDLLTAEVALETPENVGYIDADELTRWPDLAIAGTWHAGGEYIKHLKLAGLARDLRAEGANGSEDSALGWAVSGSAKLGLPFLGAKDNFRFTLH
jgi:hypothetical protein